MAGQSQTQNVDLFDAYFRRADLDRDGRISGPEAVAFFQGSNLPKQVLAQIWTHADQHRIGFLGRAEFYNALKLVTVAQSKRELTTDIVKAALYGPASAKIPAPQINLAAVPAPPSNSAAGTQQLRGATPVPQASSNASMGQPFLPSQQGHVARPPRPMPPGTGFRPQQGFPSPGMPGTSNVTALHPASTSISTNWLGGGTSSPAAGATSQVPTRGTIPSTTQDGFGTGTIGMTNPAQPRPPTTTNLMQPAGPKPNDPNLPSPHVGAKDSKGLATSGNGYTADAIFGDVFSVAASQPKPNSVAPTSSTSGLPVSSALVLPSTGAQTAVTPSPLVAAQSAFAQQSMGSQNQQIQSTVKGSQHVPVQGPTAFSSASDQSQVPWPRMSQSDVQKYTKVFVEVDTDRDGKITGEQARNLFLSWRLPREILKQVWDLSDQDNDSMLSLREFCIALYLMERYREGRSLPRTLPNSVVFDETLFPSSGQPAAAYGYVTWRPTAGLQQPQVMPGTKPSTGASRARPTNQVSTHLADEAIQPAQQKPKVPALEKHLVNQLSEEEQNSLNSKFQEATEANKKVEELEKEILDSREKIEFYRSKMQELILYKSRCDNRFNEITERTSADKREVELLAKKYEEKYKQSGDVASRLTIEEATFRDIQEKKMELYRSIVKFEHGGKTDNIQVNADKIQSELEELVKSLNERCKSYGLRAKPTTLVELPFGWQPGIQEGAADWDENWDKFEDEGFTFVKELTLDVQNVIAPPKGKSLTVEKKASPTKADVTDVATNADSKLEALQSGEEVSTDDAHRDEGVSRSPPDSPAHASESPSERLQNSPAKKIFNADGSPHATGTQSEYGGAESTVSADKNFDEPNWSSFDTHYDTDSAWDFGSGPIKEMDLKKPGESSFFDSGALGLPPIRTGDYQRKSPFIFDSVPSTPLNSGNSPQAENTYQKKSTYTFDSVPSTPQTDSFFQNRSTIAFDSVPSTPQADNLFQKKSTFAFDSVPSTPLADDLFQKKNTFVFDSVPSTPQADSLFQKKSMYAFDSVPSTPHADNLFQQKSIFADSVPSTPMHNYSNSEEYSFNSFSRFDSFNTHDSGPFAPREASLTRFDSMRSTADSDYNQGFFPPQDSFARFDSFRSTADSDTSQGLFPSRDYARFDSMRSTRDSSDFGHGFQSFEDADPFRSSGPFKTSQDVQTPRKDADNWRAF
ncbi:hypothetical protein NMG60_11007723 [Bertholletia excelsa]